MIKNVNLKQHEKTILILFVVLQIAIYITSHVSSFAATYIQYSSILLSLLFCLIFANKGIFPLLGAIALFFTACADFFLSFIPNQKVLAMVFFCFVQLVYFIYLSKQFNASQKKMNLWVRVVLVIVSEVTLWLFFQNLFNLLAALVIFYFINLVCNMIFALIHYKENPFFASGLVFFFLCDIFVGLNEMSLFFDVSSSAFFEFIFAIPFNIAWTFYIPSQALLAIATAIYSRFAKNESHH